MEQNDNNMDQNAGDIAIANRFENLHFNTITQANITELPSTECSVCQNAYVLGERVVTAGCNHIFHMQCLHQWLRGHK